MRRTSRLLFVLILGAGLGANSSAQNQPPIPGILSGQLVSGKTMVANAIVQWSIPGVPTGPSNTGVTDGNGDFAFEIPLTAPTQVQVSTVANLYNPAQMMVPLAPGQRMMVAIPLTHRASGQYAEVAGTVRNTSGLAIPNAAVSIQGAGALLTTTTDSNGKFVLKPVGFNSNLTLSVSTTFAPCISAMQIPLNVNATYVPEKIAAQPVASFAAYCPPPRPVAGGVGARQGVKRFTTDDTVQWEQADQFSIVSPGQPNAWNAGRVTDILRFPPGQGFLVATDQGGVWSIAEDAHRTAMPLSNKWDSTTMSSLAMGTGGPQDAYAATYAFGESVGGELWETDTSQSQPLLNWAKVNPQPPCSTIYKMLVVSQAQLIVLACDTGLYSSFIPAAPSVHGTYNWVQAVPAAYGSKAFSGLAQGPGWSVTGAPGTIAATRYGAPSLINLFFTATLKGGKLVLTPASVGGPSTPSNRTYVAACASNPQNMYAVGAEIYQSTNAGVDWLPVAMQPNTGLPQDFSESAPIAVSPDCSTVALGGDAGTFVSFTQGATWNMLADSGEYNNLHTDVLALTFDPVIPGMLFIGSGGGVASASGVTSTTTPTFESDWNQGLFNLEFLQGEPSGSVTGLVGGATIDNGDLYTVFPNAWQHVIDCPGYIECWGNESVFETPVAVGAGNDFLVAANMTTSAQSVESLNGAIPFNGATNIPINLSCTPCTPYTINVAAPVRSPGGAVNTSGQKMIAVSEMFVAAAGGDGIYGLFANDDGTGMQWQLLSMGMNLWSNVTAIAATEDGGSIYVGNENGQIFRLDSGPPMGALFSGAPVQTMVSTSCTNCSVTGLYAFNFVQNNPNPTPIGLAYAVYDQRFIGYFGTNWTELDTSGLPGLALLSLVATDPSRIYVACSAGVFESTNGGATWVNASTGLPTYVPDLIPGVPLPDALISERGSRDYLQLVVDPPPISDTRLYLSTYGRSVWRTFRPLPAPPKARAFTTVAIEIETGNDNLETYSELQVVLHTSRPQTFCLKPSNTSDPSPGGVCNNGPSATDQDGNQAWTNGLSVAQTFILGTPVVLDGATFEMDLFQHNSGLESPDNWDIQEVQVAGEDVSGALGVLSITNGPINGNNCMARLKASPNPSSVIYALSAANPSGINIEHPVANFGATPPGSCPQ